MLHGEASYLFFLPAILIASALGGWGPGLLATVLGRAAGHVRRHGHSRAVDRGCRQCRHLRPGRHRRFVARRAAAPLPRGRGSECRRDAFAREAHLQSILDTMPDAMIVIDERGIMQSFSAAAERLFGYSAAEVIGKERQDADAGALSRRSRRLSRSLPDAPASGASSASAGSSSAQRKDGSTFPDGARRRRNACAASSASSPASSAT